MLINGGNFLPDRKQSICSGDKRSVISNSHLLHLPLNPLGVNSKQLRLLQISVTDKIKKSMRAEMSTDRDRERNLVETIKSEGEELGDVRLVRGGSEIEKTRRRFRRRHLSNLRGHSRSSYKKVYRSRNNTGDFTIFFKELTSKMFL